MSRDLGSYIKKLNSYFSKKISGDYLEKYMVDVSNIVCSNWVDFGDYKLSKDQFYYLFKKLRKING